jgi:hypothetical protein
MDALLAIQMLLETVAAGHYCGVGQVRPRQKMKKRANFGSVSQRETGRVPHVLALEFSSKLRESQSTRERWCGGKWRLWWVMVFSS